MTKFQLIDEIEIELIDSFDVYLKVMVNMVMNVLREINEDVSELTYEGLSEALEEERESYDSFYQGALDLMIEETTEAIDEINWG